MVGYIDQVAEVLSRVHERRNKSPEDYLNEQLTRVLNAPSAVRIIEEILGDDNLLERVARRSYTHTNGFDKITLIESSNPEFKLRLHIWWPQSDITRRYEFIHNHRWYFRSTVILGSSNVEIFSEKEGGIEMHRYEYVPRDAGAERYDLRLDGKASLSSDLMFSLTPGGTYSLGPDLLHRVIWDGSLVSMTMFVRWESVSTKAAVFASDEIFDDEMLSVPSFAAGQLRLKLEKILCELMTIVDKPDM